jgi:hypothetical protein
MTTPCEQQDIIKEIRGDVKELLKFKNTALGIIVALQSMVFFIGWLISTIIK